MGEARGEETELMLWRLLNQVEMGARDMEKTRQSIHWGPNLFGIGPLRWQVEIRNKGRILGEGNLVILSPKKEVVKWRRRTSGIQVVGGEGEA